MALTSIHEVGDPVTPSEAGQRVWLQGRFDASQQVRVVDRSLDGQPGSWVLTSFVLSAGGKKVRVPVVRGWLPAEVENVPPSPRGQVRVAGYLEPSEPDALRDPTRDVPEGEVEIVSSSELVGLWEPPLLQGFVLASKAIPGQPLEAVPPPAREATTSVDWQNLAYAIQWWLFAAFACFWFWRMFQLEQREHSSGGAPDTAADLPLP